MVGGSPGRAIALEGGRALVFEGAAGSAPPGWSLRGADGGLERTPALEAILRLAPAHAVEILEALNAEVPSGGLARLPGERAACFTARSARIRDIVGDAIVLAGLGIVGELELRLRRDQVAPALEGVFTIWRWAQPNLARNVTATVIDGGLPHEAAIEAALAALLGFGRREEGALESDVTFSAPRGYVAVSARLDGRALIAEAMDPDAREDAQEAEGRRGALEEAGWSVPEPGETGAEPGNYVTTVQLERGALADLAALVSRTLVEVYGADPSGDLVFVLQDYGMARGAPVADGQLFIDLVDGLRLERGPGPLRQMMVGTEWDEEEAPAGDGPGRPAGEPGDAGEDDIGRQTLERVAGALQLDAEWTRWERRACTWWPHHAAQRVWAEPPEAFDGDAVSALWARADVLRDVDASDALTDLVDALNLVATLSAWVHDPARRTLSLVSSARVHEGSAGFAIPHFTLAVAIQAADAEFRGPALADLVGGAPHASAHPLTGARPVGDDMLNLLKDEVVPAGSGDPLVSQRALAALAGADGPWRQAGVRDGVFGAVLAPGGRRRGRARDITLAIGPQTDHPQLGAGLLVNLRLPETGSTLGAKPLAAALNRLEAERLRGPHLLGAWSATHQRPGVQFAAFVPNYLLRGLGSAPAFYLNWALVMCARARWAEEAIAELAAART